MRAVYLVFILVFVSACVSYDNHDTNTAAGSYGLAKQLEDDERFEESVMQYRDVKNRFPYSSFAIEAELRLAEVQFKKEAYPEAQAAYQLFKELHPKHAQVAYVSFQIGESLFLQFPSTTDRDLSLAPQAIRQYQSVINHYGQTPFAEKAKKKIIIARNMMADKELYIADFYYRTEKFLNALIRYEKYIKEFPENPKIPYVYYQAGLSADASKNGDKKSTYFRYLIEKYPGSSEAKKAQRSL